MYRVLEHVSKQMYPGITVMPSMSTGASDKAQLRAKVQQLAWHRGRRVRVKTPSITAMRSDVELLAGEPSIYRFVEYVWNAVTEVASSSH